MGSSEVLWEAIQHHRAVLKDLGAVEVGRPFHHGWYHAWNEGAQGDEARYLGERLSVLLGLKHGHDLSFEVAFQPNILPEVRRDRELLIQFLEMMLEQCRED